MAGCATTTLSPYVPGVEMPWNRRRVLHAYRRMSFGTHFDNIDIPLATDPATFVDGLIDEAANAPAYFQPEWWDWGYTDYINRGLDEDRIFDDSVSLGFDWAREMVEGGFLPRIKMFWLNHFVIKLDDVFCSSAIWKYMNILHSFSLGNFKEFTYQIGVTPAMLNFLNGDQNNKFEPNENYARELFELFTLGRDIGYTQQDVVETSRALTGWRVGNCNTAFFDGDLFDTGQKTIFGKTEAFDHRTLIDHLFDVRGDLIASFICRKLYIEFVSDVVDETIVEGLATTFLNSNFELEPVYRQLFKSEHFFDNRNIGVKIKSPYQLTLSMIAEFNAPISDEFIQNLYWVNASVGQDLFNPPDVAGWEGNRSWVDSSTLAIRWTLVDAYSWYIFDSSRDELRLLAKMTSGNSSDVEQVSQSLVEYFLPAGLHTDLAYNSALVAFKDEVPQNYFDDGIWNLDLDFVPFQMVKLIQHLGRQPEFQMY